MALSLCCKFTTESYSEEFWKSVNIWRSYMQEYSVLFFIDSQCSVLITSLILHMPMTLLQHIFMGSVSQWEMFSLIVWFPSCSKVTRIFFFDATSSWSSSGDFWCTYYNMNNKHGCITTIHKNSKNQNVKSHWTLNVGLKSMFSAVFYSNFSPVKHYHLDNFCSFDSAYDIRN